MERFGNKSSRDKHLAKSAAEDQDVTTLERKRNKAQKVGMAIFGAAHAGSDAPILPQGFNLKRVSREMDPPRPEEVSPLATTSSASSGAQQNHKQMRVPVNGVKLLPADGVPLRPQGSKQPPATAPKPSTPPLRQMPADSNPNLLANGFSFENPNFSNHPGSPPTSYYNTLPTAATKSNSLGSSYSLSSAEGGTTLRRPLAAENKGEISLDFGDASLGFSIIQERVGRLNRLNSNSVPDLLSDEGDVRSPQHLYSSKVHPRHRQLGSSLGDLLDDAPSNHAPTTYTDGIRPRTSTESSSASGHSESPRHTKQVLLPMNPPPRVSQQDSILFVCLSINVCTSVTVRSVLQTSYIISICRF